MATGIDFRQTQEKDFSSNEEGGRRRGRVGAEEGGAGGEGGEKKIL